MRDRQLGPDWKEIDLTPSIFLKTTKSSSVASGVMNTASPRRITAGPWLGAAHFAGEPGIASKHKVIKIGNDKRMDAYKARRRFL